jgi:hypothetical protein
MRWKTLPALGVAGALIGVFMGGCATDVGPTKEELKARWEAQNVYPETFKADLLAFLRTYLNNPSQVRGALVSRPALRPLGDGDRYVVCVRYRERKDNGTYAAARDGAATYVSAKLDRFFDGKAEVKALCADAAMEPFPELEKLTR